MAVLAVRRGTMQIVAPGGGGALDLSAFSPHVNLDPDTFGLIDGDPVATAVDTSASGPDWTQATSAARPTLRGGASLLNGHFVVEHDSVDDYLAGPNLSGLANGHAFIVMKLDADPPASTGQSGLWRLGTDGADVHVPWTDGNIYDDAGRTSRQAVGNPAASLASWRIYEVRSAPNDWEVKVDGTSIFSTGTSTVSFQSAPYLGKAAGTVFLDGRWAYFGIFPALSSGDAATVRGLLQTHFAL